MADVDGKSTKTSSLNLEQPQSPPEPTWKLVLVASIAAGVQFGWALQLSLLTPYVQLLGIPHKWAAFIWLCGPISGMIVQPTVGYYSDRSTNPWGRRRPYIAAGAALVAVAVILIGFAADIGHATGDLAAQSPKPRAIAVFVVGFWILDVANNMLQGPCRAFLADLAAENQSKTRLANSFFSFFMAVGNVLGYAAGSYRKLYKIFPFTETAACDVYCANLKSCFFISIFLLAVVTVIALSVVKEKRFFPEQLEAEEKDAKRGIMRIPVFGELFGAFKDLPRSMWILLIVTCLNWIGWFPFLLYDTDWMGREVYGGEVGEGKIYDNGVSAGSLGLMLNSIVSGATALAIGSLARVVGGPKRLWGIVNVILAVCLAMTVLVTKQAEHARHDWVAAGHPGGEGLPPPPEGIKIGALALFAVLGIPLAITYSIPFALASIFSVSTGSGQGLSLGVLNLSIVVPQMFVSVVSGPWDSLFGGGNLPAFVVGAIAAAVSAVLAFTILPSPPRNVSIEPTAGGH